MIGQDRLGRHSSSGPIDWPAGPMSLWQKIGGVLVITMLLAFIALASVSEDPGERHTPAAIEQSLPAFSEIGPLQQAPDAGAE